MENCKIVYEVVDGRATMEAEGTGMSLLISTASIIEVVAESMEMSVDRLMYMLKRSVELNAILARIHSEEKGFDAEELFQELKRMGGE